MSTAKKISPKGVHQEDMVEMVYYLWKAHGSILTYLSNLNYIVSNVFNALSNATTSVSISYSGSIGSVNYLSAAGFPTSMTTLTGCSITLV
jgi:hypothetical protein